MSEIYRRISLRMWGDEDFRRLSGPQPNARYLWIYLLTGPHTTAIPGLFSATREGLAAQLKWPIKAFLQALAELTAQSGPNGKAFLEADWESGVVWIAGAIRHNEPGNPNVVRHFRVHFELIPECPLKRKAAQSLLEYSMTKSAGFQQAFADVFGNGTGKAFANPSGNGSANGSAKAFGKAFGKAFDKGSGAALANQDQEQDQEQDLPKPFPSPTLPSPNPSGLDPDPPDPPPQVPPGEPLRFKQPLEDAVRAEFFARNATAQKASAGQWRDGCNTVAEAMNLGLFAAADEAIAAYARLLVDECGRGEKLGFALQNVQLGQPQALPVPDEKLRWRPNGQGATWNS